MEGRRATASVLVGLGTGLKLWPIVLFPLVLGRRPARPALALGLTGLVLVVLSLATGGWDRLLSPLAYQRDRGLQIEAVAATVPMRLRDGSDAYGVWFSRFNAYEVTGPSVGQWLAIAQAGTVVGAVACLALLVWWFRRGARPELIAWLALVLVGTFIVTSRALSPQYLVWLAAPAAVLVAIALRGAPDAPPAGPALLTFTLVLVVCPLTTAIYPVYYDSLLWRSADTDRALTLLTWRNLGLLALVAWSAACALSVGRGAWTPTRGVRDEKGAVGPTPLGGEASALE